MRRRTATAGLAIAFVLAAGLGACGGNDEGGDTGATATETTTETGAPTTTEAEGGMPDLSGLSVEKAGDELSATLNSYDMTITYEESSEPSGTVIDQTPAAGTPLEPGKVYKVEVVASK